MKCIFSDESVLDAHGDRVLVAGIGLDRYKENNVLLYQHNAYQLPIGRVNDLRVEGLQLVGEVEFYDEDEFSKKVAKMYEQGFLNAFSIGFKSIESIDKTITKCELYEISCVVLPANQNALVQRKSIENLEQKTYCPIIINTKSEMNEFEKKITEAVDELMKKVTALETELSAQKKAVLEQPSVLVEAIKSYTASQQEKTVDERKDWTLIDWQKKDSAGLGKMRTESPEKFKALVEKL